jgi:hypothetical protein
VSDKVSWEDWSEVDWCNALEIVVSDLAHCFMRTRQDSMALLVFAENSYMGKNTHPDVSHIGFKRAFVDTGGRLFRVIRYGQLLDILFDIGGYGECSLFGVPEETISKNSGARSRLQMRVGYDDASCLLSILEPNTPYFDLTVYTSQCLFWISYAPECPEDIRQILYAANQRRPQR